MKYYKIELLSGSEAYALIEYLQYVDDVFFESVINDINNDDEMALCIGNLFVQLYKDELAFKQNVRQYRYIVPAQPKNEKISKANNRICSNIARILGLKIIDCFDFIEILKRDKVNEDTKKSYKINKKYEDTPVIIFNLCCSTGTIFNDISSIPNISKDNIYFAYGVRSNAEIINNSKIKRISEYSYEYDVKNKIQGYSVKIYGLFGEKNVEVDLRDQFSINIGENGYGKSTAAKMAVLGMIHTIGGDEDTNRELQKYYFDKIEVYYHDYYYNFPELENDENIVNDNNRHVVRFIDSNDFCFHQQSIRDGQFINCALLKVFGLDNHIETVNNSQKPIVKDMQIVYSDFEITYDFLVSNGSCVKSLVDTIYYDEICGINDLMNENFENNTIYSFAKKIKKEELREIVRKIIMDDRSIDVLYSKLGYIYGFSDVELKKIDKELRDKYRVSKQGGNGNYKYLCLYDEGYPEEYYMYFNCAMSREIIAKPPREGITTNHYYYKHYEDFTYGYEHDDNIESDEFKDYDYDAPEMFNYPEMFYENMDNMYYQSLSSLKGSLGTEEKIVNDDSDLFFEYADLLTSNRIKIFEIVNKFLLGENIKTCFYDIVMQIIEYSKRSYDNLDMVRIYLDSKHYIYISIKEYMNLYKNDIEEIYNNILKDELISFSFGVYDALNEKEYKEILKIVRNITANGLRHISDYIVIVGLNILLKEYNREFITERHILYEKLVNKYLVNKTMKVFHSNIIIQDNNGNYVPVDKLSTGEKNLIILLGLCLSWQNNIIALDEPDLSMSVEWQSKLLVDLLRYTNNRYLIISQSPLLVQKNSLSPFVKRFDLCNEDQIVDYKILMALKNIHNIF